MVADIGPSSVRSPSRSHISKTKQDRPTVSMEHYIEIGTADSFAAFRSSLRRPSRELFWFQIKTREHKIALGHMIPPPLHMCNRLARPADDRNGTSQVKYGSFFKTTLTVRSG